METLSLAIKLRYMFEYMRLCGDPTQFEERLGPQPYPIPSGVPMGLVTLPDFVVDVAVDGLRGHAEPIDVGGRAGRLARVLHDFGGPWNGWYTVTYAATAGDLGRVTLERRFQRPTDPRDDFEPMSLRYILKSTKGKDWLAVYEAAVQTAESSDVGHALTVKGIDDSPASLTDLFIDARYVVVSAKRAEHAVNALKVLAQGLERVSSYCRKQDGHLSLRIPLGILLDLSALGDPSAAGNVADVFKATVSHAAAFDIESTALCSEETNCDTDGFTHVLVRTADTLRVAGHTQPIPKLDTYPMAREALTAGYVLASSADLGWRLLRRWHRLCPNMRPIDDRPHRSTPERGSPAQTSEVAATMLPSVNGDEPAVDPVERVRFAAALARHAVAVTAPDLVTYGGLIKHLSEAQSPLPMATFDAAEVASVQSVPGDVDSLALQAAVTLRDHLVPRFEDHDANGTLSLYLPPTQPEVLAAACRLRDTRRCAIAAATTRHIDKAVMFDLDATLVDSGGMLRACWMNGLRTFFRHVNPATTNDDIHVAFKIYKTFVYDRSKDFLKLLDGHPDIPPEWQPCDFRQVWNHRYAWATLLWLLGSTARRQRWHEAFAQHHATACTCTLCVKLSRLFPEKMVSVAAKRELTLPLRDQLAHFRFQIHAARVDFWNIDYPAYPQARSCVQALRAMPGCEVYVVTEGHEETQVQKLKCAGLTDLFPRERVLSTGAASAAEQLKIDLVKLTQLSKRTLDKIEKASAAASLGQERETHASVDFLRSLLEILNTKGNEKFYSLVIDAIRRRPKSPAQTLQSFLERRPENRAASKPMQFFMIGDRYDNDCQPLLNMNLSSGDSLGVGTCRLLSGKRWTDQCPPRPTPVLPAPPTMYVCDTLAQVTFLLQHAETWKRIEVLKDEPPPVLLVSEGDKGIKGAGAQEPLDRRFRELSWARGDHDLLSERAVQDMLVWIERDLAVCDVLGLSRFLAGCGDAIRSWSVSSASEAAEGILLTGALQFLVGVNWWRHMLRRPLLAHAVKPKATLAWTLGEILLSVINVDLLETEFGDLEWTGRPMGTFHEIGDVNLVKAFPYSPEAIAIMEALQRDVRVHNRLLATIGTWLGEANSLPRASDRDQYTHGDQNEP